MASSKQDLLDSLYPSRSPANAENMALSNFARTNDKPGEAAYLKGKNPWIIDAEYRDELNKILSSSMDRDNLSFTDLVKGIKSPIDLDPSTNPNAYKIRIKAPVREKGTILYGYTEPGKKQITASTPLNLLHELAHESDIVNRPDFFSEKTGDSFGDTGLDSAELIQKGHFANTPMLSRSMLWNLVNGLPAYQTNTGYNDPYTGITAPSGRATIYNRIQSGY